MNKPIITLILVILFSNSFSQTNDISTSSIDYFYGAWYDSTKESTGGSGFIFMPDSCCNLIINGNITDCINEKEQVKVIYQVNSNIYPKQLDISFIDLNADSTKARILMIFEIIDQDHFRFAVYKDLINIRPLDFNNNSDSEISILTRYIENDK